MEDLSLEALYELRTRVLCMEHPFALHLLRLFGANALQLAVGR
jgi:hypothetical protein